MLHEIDDLDLADDVPRLSLRRTGSYPLNSWLPSWLEAGVDASLSRKCARMLWSWTSLMPSPMREISKTAGIRAGGDQEAGGTGRCPRLLPQLLRIPGSACHRSILSTNGASTFPQAIHQI